MTLLKIRHLAIGFPDLGTKEVKPVVHQIELDVHKGEMVGILGESGSGKTVSTKGILRVPSEHFVVTEGELIFEEVHLERLSEKSLRQLRGSSIGYIPQNASDALTPHETVWRQMKEMGHLHGKGITKAMAAEALESVGVHNPEVVLHMAAHQLSGGMAQRVVIAMTSLLSPKLIIADEPTSAVDATLKASVLDLLRDIGRRHGTAILIITHDFEVVERLCHRAYVLYKGRLMEAASVKQLLERPKHPYTQMLMGCVRELASPLPETAEKMAAVQANESVLVVKGLKKTYWVGGSLLKPPRAVEAVKDLTLSLPRGSCYGLIGESGSGKSTVAKLIMGLIGPDDGDIALGDQVVVRSGRRLLKDHDRTFKQAVQVVFQLASNPLDPKRTVRDLVSDPFRLSGAEKPKDLEATLVQLLDQVKLPRHYLDRLPGELSGGERQRICIARALAVQPKLLILDEPVSALDVSVQGQMMALLMELQATLGLTYLLITHDMQLAKRYCTHIGVMYRGDLLESGLASDVLENPQTAYTQELIKSLV